MTHRNRTDDEAESPEAKKRKREEFERERAKSERERDNARRKMFTVFKLWTVCPDKRCARAKACSGDVETCLRARWQPIVPPEVKALLHKAMTLMNEGVPGREAWAAAQKEMAERERIMAKMDARHAEKPAVPAPTAPPPIRRSVPVSHSPRVRGLV